MSVLVYTQNWDGRFKKSSFELVSYGSKVAELLNTSLVCLSIGAVSDEELKKLGNYGAKKVIRVDGVYCKTLDNQVYTDIICTGSPERGCAGHHFVKQQRRKSCRSAVISTVESRHGFRCKQAAAEP